MHAYMDGRFWELRALRARIVTAEPELRGRARASYYPFEHVLAEAIGRDLGQPGNSLIPRLAASSAVAGMRELYESDEAQALAAPPSAAELLRLVDTVIRFVQAGLEGGERPPPPDRLPLRSRPLLTPAARAGGSAAAAQPLLTANLRFVAGPDTWTLRSRDRLKAAAAQARMTWLPSEHGI
jgi:MftR C-terminal domain